MYNLWLKVYLQMISNIYQFFFILEQYEFNYKVIEFILLIYCSTYLNLLIFNRKFFYYKNCEFKPTDWYFTFTVFSLLCLSVYFFSVHKIVLNFKACTLWPLTHWLVILVDSQYGNYDSQYGNYGNTRICGDQFSLSVVNRFMEM